MDTRRISYPAPTLDEVIDFMNEKKQREKEQQWSQQYGAPIQGLEQPWIDPIDALAGGLTAIPKGLGVAATEAAIDPLVGFGMEQAFDSGNALAAMPTKRALRMGIPKKAKEFFGTTRNPAESGYITHEGDLLDMSGRHYGDPGPNPGRGVDHRELGGWSRYTGDEDVYLTEKGGTEGMFEFMNESGAVRWMPEASGASATAPPTREQASRLIKNFTELRKYGGPDTLLLGADNPISMNQIASVDMERPNIDKVMKFYENAFEGVGHKGKNYDIDRVNWSKAAKSMKQQGYDIRGAEDAKRIFSRYQTGEFSKVPDQWVTALSYATE